MVGHAAGALISPKGSQSTRGDVVTWFMPASRRGPHGNRAVGSAIGVLVLSLATSGIASADGSVGTPVSQRRSPSVPVPCPTSQRTRPPTART